MNSEPIFSVSDFVAVFNQTLEFAYPSVTIVGELANFRISKNQWLYFSLKDETASINFFGTKFHLPGPLEEGMLLQVKGKPRLHPLYGFSINVDFISVSGEGSIKKAYQLLETKLTKEGLFDEVRKRPLPYPPASIGLITSSESAALNDFCKILNQRWGGINIDLIDVVVQGQGAVDQIVRAIDYFNTHAQPPDVLVITRGGGSADDLAAFSAEQVVRAVAASRIPTLVAIGHERDISLSEKAADKRASTPSNAAELLVPDRRAAAIELAQLSRQLTSLVQSFLKTELDLYLQFKKQLRQNILERIKIERQRSISVVRLIKALSPATILSRGYSVVRDKTTQKTLKSAKLLQTNQAIDIQFSDGRAGAVIKEF